MQDMQVPRSFLPTMWQPRHGPVPQLLRTADRRPLSLHQGLLPHQWCADMSQSAPVAQLLIPKPFLNSYLVAAGASMAFCGLSCGANSVRVLAHEGVHKQDVQLLPSLPLPSWPLNHKPVPQQLPGGCGSQHGVLRPQQRRERGQSTGEPLRLPKSHLPTPPGMHQGPAGLASGEGRDPAADHRGCRTVPATSTQAVSLHVWRSVRPLLLSTLVA